jgi:hypothetical protein
MLSKRIKIILIKKKLFIQNIVKIINTKLHFIYLFILRH